MSCGCGSIQVKFKKLVPEAVIPAYQTKGAAGFDLAAIEDTMIWPGETKVIKTGLACEIPPGYEMQVRPRSGIALKTPLLMKNAPGTVDSDYRGELGIVMHCIHHGDNRAYLIRKGDRIAQGVIAKLADVEICEVVELTDTLRGAGGYGSTGVNNG